MTRHVQTTWLAGLMLIGAALAGCAAPADTAAPADEWAAGPVSIVRPQPDPALDADPAACAAAGGEIKPRGMMQIPICIVPYADAGKVCRDTSECAGECILGGTEDHGTGPVTGFCQRENAQFGCYAEIRNGRAQPALCAD